MSARKRSRRDQSASATNAAILARRDHPYLAQHEASVALTRVHPRVRVRTTRDMARHVVREFAMETPERIHEGYTHTGDDGTPRMAAEFVGFITAPTAADRLDPEFRHVGRDDVIQGYLRWPNRAALDAMKHSASGKVQRLARIVEAIVNGDGARDAALREGAHPDDADDTARRALEAFIANRSALKITGTGQSERAHE